MNTNFKAGDFLVKAIYMDLIDDDGEIEGGDILIEGVGDLDDPEAIRANSAPFLEGVRAFFTSMGFSAEAVKSVEIGEFLGQSGNQRSLDTSADFAKEWAARA